MNTIIDRSMLVIFATLTCFLEIEPTKAVAPLLVMVTLTCINEYFSLAKLAIRLFFGYGILCLFVPEFLFLYPVLLYDLFGTKYRFYTPIAIIPFMIHFSQLSLLSITVLLCTTAIAYWLRKKTTEHKILQHEYISKRDSLTEMSITLESKVAELLHKQDDDVTLATLNERNRIAREIHDNVGHLLSSSILQLGALMAVAKQEDIKESLSILKETLSTGMNSIRSSVHNLQDDAVDLYQQVRRLIDEFSFCKAELIYDMNETMPIEARYTIIAIIKEALSNIIKHSNATKVTVSLYEHPKLYQLIISDNGSKQKNMNNAYGMGLENMKQRISGLNGIINITHTEGFRIFISFPKENV